MNLILVLLGLSTAIIFMYRMEWLTERRCFIVNLLYDILLFLGSIFLINGELGNPRILGALKMPLFSSFAFFILSYGFKKKYKRNPKNTFWTFTKEPIQDVIFTLLFWLLGVGLPFLIFT